MERLYIPVLIVSARCFGACNYGRKPILCLRHFYSRRPPLAPLWTSRSGIARFPRAVFVISDADVLTVIDLINSKGGIETGSQNSEGKALGGRAPELSCERDLERDPFVTMIPCQIFVALAVSIIQVKSNLCLNWRFTPTPQMRIYKRI